MHFQRYQDEKIIKLIKEIISLLNYFTAIIKAKIYLYFVFHSATINVFRIYARSFPDLFDQEDACEKINGINNEEFKRYLSARQPNNTEDVSDLLRNLSDRKAALDVVFNKAVEMDAFDFFELRTYVVLAQLTLSRSGERPEIIDISSVSKNTELIFPTNS